MVHSAEEPSIDVVTRLAPTPAVLPQVKPVSATPSLPLTALEALSWPFPSETWNCTVMPGSVPPSALSTRTRSGSPSGCPTRQLPFCSGSATRVSGPGPLLPSPFESPQAASTTALASAQGANRRDERIDRVSEGGRMSRLAAPERAVESYPGKRTTGA